MTRIDFRTSNYFPDFIRLGGIALLFTGLLAFLTNVTAGIILCFIGFILVSSHYRLTIDFPEKIYRDYLWILGLKKGEARKFEHIEYIFIKRNMMSQTMNLRVASSTVTKYVFDGYLKFSEQDKVYLLSRDNKKNLIKKLKQISAKLNVKILDYSEGIPQEIS
jgi:hypothetical protein